MGAVVTVTPMGVGLYRVTDGTRTWAVAVAGPPENRWVWVDGQVARLDPPTAAKGRPRSGPKRDDLTAPMPATVVRITVAVGARVARGDTLLMLEAMKMELPIRAPRAGVVTAVHCTPGELVQPGVNLIDLG
jgi:biotin carboxyl carrier protein